MDDLLFKDSDADAVAFVLMHGHAILGTEPSEGDPRRQVILTSCPKAVGDALAGAFRSTMDATTGRRHTFRFQSLPQTHGYPAHAFKTFCMQRRNVLAAVMEARG